MFATSRSDSHWFFGFVSFLVLGASNAYAKKSVLRVRIADLHPTQIAVGLKEVDFKVGRLLEERAKGEQSFNDYLIKKKKQIVIGPGKELFTVDGHHSALSLYRIKEEYQYVEVLADYSNYEYEAFLKKMLKKHYLYLKDENGKPVSFEDLPKHVWQMRDDRHRSLAWMVIESKCVRKLEIPFFEFEWADFFRSRIHFNGDKLKDWKVAYHEAMAYSVSHEASALPGYYSKPEGCKDVFSKLVGKGA